MAIDWQLTIIILLCLISGFGFAWLAVRLTQTAGNTIADAQKAAQAGNQQAAFEASGPGWKLTAGTPIVALYVIAVVCAIGLPAWFIYETQSQDQLITMVVPLANAPSGTKVVESAPRFDGTALYLTAHSCVPASDFVAYGSAEYYPLSFDAEYDRGSRSVKLAVGSKPLGVFNLGTTNQILVPPVSFVSRTSLNDLKLEAPQQQAATAAHAQNGG